METFINGQISEETKEDIELKTFLFLTAKRKIDSMVTRWQVK